MVRYDWKFGMRAEPAAFELLIRWNASSPLFANTSFVNYQDSCKQRTLSTSMRPFAIIATTSQRSHCSPNRQASRAFKCRLRGTTHATCGLGRRAIASQVLSGPLPTWAWVRETTLQSMDLCQLFEGLAARPRRHRTAQQRLKRCQTTLWLRLSSST